MQQEVVVVSDKWKYRRWCPNSCGKSCRYMCYIRFRRKNGQFDNGGNGKYHCTRCNKWFQAQEVQAYNAADGGREK